RDVADGLDVVDDGGAPVEAHHRRKRRLDARLRALALERLDERRLFAGLVGAGAPVDPDVAVGARAEDVLAPVAGRTGLREFGLHLLLDVVELAADVDVARLRAEGPAGDHAALEQQMRVALEQHVVLERPRLALVGVDAQVLRLRVVLRHEAPLQARREAGAAPAAQAGALHLVGDRLGRHLERLAQGLVAAVLDVEVEGVAEGLVHVRCENRFEHAYISRLKRRLTSWTAPWPGNSPRAPRALWSAAPR